MREQEVKMIKKGESPLVFIRDQPGFKERGSKKFYYSYKDIATLLRVKINTVQHLVSAKKLDPKSLKSIVREAVLRRVFDEDSIPDDSHAQKK